jgi:hypothetical protein
VRRFLMLVSVAVVAAAMYVAASSASQASKGPTAKQFSALKKQVAGLSKQVKVLTAANKAVVGVLAACIQGAVPIADFGDPNGTFGYHWVDSTNGEILTTALDVTSPSDPNALWITGSTGSNACQTTLGSFALHRAAAKAGIKLLPLRLPSTFAAHPH